ncbi:4Fe-4S binding protein [Carboxylicivirga marina]|uniref:4Fe-4S binding protein n=1 Tax=Carboxylicivirga marina TaxID=2800988 RepID=A0ABS1HFI7_9BACT|nr:4Fe-4S binding protein [Carboxylicivirga marina]MBK3516058.1 4Fe-4S binding protein [Carboxylicivirga marina]
MSQVINYSSLKPAYNIKAKRTFTVVRKYAFLFTLMVAIAGQFEPKLGLLVIPIMIGLLIASFFKGRYWCGNICSHGSYYDSLLLPFSRNTKIPKFMQWTALSLIVMAWFGFRMGTGFMRAAESYGTADFWDKTGVVFVNAYMMVVMVGTTFSLLVSPRMWCNVCPMGFMQKLSHFMGRKAKVTKATEEMVTISDEQQCHKCAKCARVCPMQLSPYNSFNKKNQFDSNNCIKCSTCVGNCPAGILTFSNENTARFITKNVKKEAGENRGRFTTTIHRITALKGDVKEFVFQLSDESIKFKAGQFILVKIQDKPEMFRAFSVSYFDEENNRIGVTVKKAPNGYGSEILFNDFEEGMTVVLEGPLGDEIVIDEKTKKAVFVGGGIGITPFVPLVQDAIERDQIEEVKLIYGVNKESELIYIDKFKAMEKENNKFEFIPVIAFDDKWPGQKGFVTNVLEQLDLTDNVIYMCGPKPMIDASLKTLSQLGVKKEKIRYESA